MQTKLVNNKYPILTSRICSECGSNLLLVEEKTEIVEDQLSPVTTSIFQCSDNKCKKEFDMRTALRMKLIKEQETARVKRIENIKLNRMKTIAKR